ncbi:hypothetical protein NCAS_0D04780 [Naumovozyma castellii]|uniref:Transcriptional repressor Tup1 N-terminal domain-containing protein n=1 Tax=Naumovozyma castellii TaxID=27288 RepID=G0VER8_NAUCA|nr:hypothetical protein NCAS_0D04780 [Naumovozyma castellii CBS 4309]CCC70059.1 hypothetical protein NCAS_0D04780 [Naumovozyma castellii CBS 4309]
MVANNVNSNGKVEDLLDAVRQEFMQLSQEANSYRLQNQKTYDLKLNQHLAEMQQIRNTVYELELAHRKIKEGYEDEINRLKVELEQKNQQLANFNIQGQLLPVNTANTSAFSNPKVLHPNPPAPIVSSIQQPTTVLPVLNTTTQVQPQGLQGNGEPLQAPQSSLQSPNGQQLAPLSSNPPSETSNSVNNIANAAETLPSIKTSDGNGLPTAAMPASTDLVKSDELSKHVKPIPPFLLNTTTMNVPSEFKKERDEYSLFFNPNLTPTELDVDLLHSLPHDSVVCCVKFSQDGKYLATGCNRTTQIFDVATGELYVKLLDDTVNTAIVTTTTENNETVTTTADLYIRSICFSPDGEFLATGAEDKLIRIWNIKERKIVMVLKGHEQDIYSLDYFPDGQKLVSGSGDRSIRIWDLKTGQCSLTLSIEDGVTTVAVSPNEGKLIAAGSLDRSVRIWDSSTGFLVERLDSDNESGNGHQDSVYSVAFTKDGQHVVSGSLDRTVKLWNLGDTQSGTGKCEVTYIGHKDFVLSVATSNDDKYIFSGSKDRGVIIWDKDSGNPILMLQGHRNSVISVATVNSNVDDGKNYKLFATGSGDCKARIWKYFKMGEVTAKIEDTETKTVTTEQ